MKAEHRRFTHNIQHFVVQTDLQYLSTIYLQYDTQTAKQTANSGSSSSPYILHPATCTGRVHSRATSLETFSSNRKLFLPHAQTATAVRCTSWCPSLMITSKSNTFPLQAPYLATSSQAGHPHGRQQRTPNRYHFDGEVASVFGVTRAGSSTSSIASQPLQTGGRVVHVRRCQLAVGTARRSHARPVGAWLGRPQRPCPRVYRNPRKPWPWIISVRNAAGQAVDIPLRLKI